MSSPSAVTDDRIATAVRMICGASLDSPPASHAEFIGMASAARTVALAQCDDLNDAVYRKARSLVTSEPLIQGLRNAHFTSSSPELKRAVDAVEACAHARALFDGANARMLKALAAYKDMLTANVIEGADSMVMNMYRTPHVKPMSVMDVHGASFDVVPHSSAAELDALTTADFVSRCKRSIDSLERAARAERKAMDVVIRNQRKRSTRSQPETYVQLHGRPLIEYKDLPIIVHRGSIFTITAPAAMKIGLTRYKPDPQQHATGTVALAPAVGSDSEIARYDWATSAWPCNVPIYIVDLESPERTREMHGVHVILVNLERKREIGRASDAAAALIKKARCE